MNDQDRAALIAMGKQIYEFGSGKWMQAPAREWIDTISRITGVPLKQL
jgi:hypothetical protein